MAFKPKTIEDVIKELRDSYHPGATVTRFSITVKRPHGWSRMDYSEASVKKLEKMLEKSREARANVRLNRHPEK